jgi:hypothetical protein
MTSLEGLADLRDRLARAILRIEADDWLSVEQLGFGGDMTKRKPLFRRFLEPSIIPLVVGALTLITAVVTVVERCWICSPKVLIVVRSMNMVGPQAQDRLSSFRRDGLTNMLQ